MGRRVGGDNFYNYCGKLGLLSKTGIDIAGEASTIIHNKENVGEVELATMSFGQSFQITPIQMLRAAAKQLSMVVTLLHHILRLRQVMVQSRLIMSSIILQLRAQLTNQQVIL